MSRTPWDEERVARAALAAVHDPGGPELDDPPEAGGASQRWAELRSADTALGRRARALDPGRLVSQCEELGARFIMPGDPEWPTKLEDVAGCDRSLHQGLGGVPLGLWARGPLGLAEACDAAVAVVGARAATSYGQDVAIEMAHDLARPGGRRGSQQCWTVVSGGAYGIDVAAHRGALTAGGRTICVQAGGLDELYPRGNGAVLARILEEGLLVSESAPGRRPTRPGFLARNRVIAGLTDGVVIVEAAARSGALSTANWAGDMYREVLAVPGPVTSSRSVGPHDLIRNRRAELVRDADDVREALGPIQPELPREPVPEHPTDALGPETLRVHEALPARGALGVDELSRAALVSLTDCLLALQELEDRGMASYGADGRWSVRLRR